MAKAGNILVYALLVSIYANAQQLQDTIRLQESEIIGRRTQAQGQRLTSGSASGLDWAVQPLSEISYKTYGLSGVGSLSYRGLPASQTPLLWHGISLASPLLGQTDINQTPISPEWAAYASGAGQGALSGGNALPSAVAIGHRTMLSDTSRQEIQVRTRLTTGLYGARQSETAVEARRHALSLQARVWYQQATNNFPLYRSGSSDPLLPTRQTNAETRNLQQEYGLGYRVSQHYRLSAGVLYNHSDRNLPPPLTKYRSLENLDSRLCAVNLSQVLEGKSLKYTSTVGFVRDFSRYRFENGVDVSPYATGSLQATGNLISTVAEGLELRFDHTHQWAKPLEGPYPARILQTHAAVISTVFSRKGWTVEPSVQVHGLGGRAYGYPNIRITRSQALAASTRLQVQMQTRGLFRSPTLNDLYYPQSGNPDLRPEQGRLYEMDARLIQGAYEIGLTPFLYRYRSFIAWVPQGNLWAPRQRENAAVSGLTALFGYARTYRSLRSTARLQGTWSRSGFGGTWITALQRPEPFLYAPAARLTGSLALEYQNLRLTYSASYTGSRTIDSRGEAPQLKPFWLHTLQGEWSRIQLPKGSLQFAAQANWATPAGYAFIANYGAPHFWGSLSLIYQIGYARQ